MEEVTLEKIYEFIDDYSEQYTLTPQIWEQKIVESVPSAIHRANEFIEHQERPINIESTLRVLTLNVPDDFKEKISALLTEEEKDSLFKLYLKNNGCNLNIEDDVYEAKCNHVLVSTTFVKNIKESLYSKSNNAIPETYFLIKNLKLDTISWIPTNVKKYINRILNMKVDLGDKLVSMDEYIKLHIAKCEEDNIKEIEESKKVEHKVKVSNTLKEYILKGMPNDFSKLEKAIYIYLKLCDTLTYAEDWFLAGEHLIGKTKTIENHTNINKIKDINEENNELVCFQFAYIYSEFLRLLGIEHIKEHDLYPNGNFGSGHAFIKFLIDDNIIFADSTRSVLEGDLINTKVDDRISGIRSESYFKDKQKMVQEEINKVKKVLYDEKKDRYHIKETEDTFEQRDKLKILFSTLNSTNLKGIDLICLISKLVGKLDIDSDNIKCNLYEKDSKSYIVITFNSTSLKFNPYQTYRVIIPANEKKYYIPKENNKLDDLKFKEKIPKQKYH